MMQGASFVFNIWTSNYNYWTRKAIEYRPNIENLRSIFAKPASFLMMQGCIIAHDAPPLDKTLILLNNIFNASNDLNTPFFWLFFEGSAQIKKRCSDQKKRQKRKMAKYKLEVWNPL